MSNYYVYRFINNSNKVIYVGRTNSIVSRISTHLSNGHLPKECYDSIKRIDYLECLTKNDMKIKELYYIGKFRPPFNTMDNHGATLSLDEIADCWVEFKIKKKDLGLLEKVSESEKIVTELTKGLEATEAKLKSITNELRSKEVEISELKFKSAAISNSHFLRIPDEDCSFQKAVDIISKKPDKKFANFVDGKIKRLMYNLNNRVAFWHEDLSGADIYLTNDGESKLSWTYEKVDGSGKSIPMEDVMVICDNWVELIETPNDLITA